MPAGVKACCLISVLAFKWDADGKLARFKVRNCIAQVKKKEENPGQSCASAPTHKAMRILQTMAAQLLRA